MTEETIEPKKNDNSCGENGTNSLWKRRGDWTNIFAAIKLAAGTREKFRTADKVTDIVLALSVSALLVVVYVPIPSFKPLLVFICDGLVILTIVVFIMKRLGVLTTLAPRKAALIWDIIFGTAFLAIMLAINLVAALAYLRQIPDGFSEMLPAQSKPSTTKQIQ